jgi:hypothetical protein
VTILRSISLPLMLCILGCASQATGQNAPHSAPPDNRTHSTPPLPTGYGSLTQSDVALGVRNDDIEIRFVPLQRQLAPLMATDAYNALQGLVTANRARIDSVASRRGVAQPGLALVTFFGVRSNARFDPQILTLQIHNRVYQPLGTVPLSPRFTSGQLGMREQASAIYVYEEEIPVNDSFTYSYGSLVSSDWQIKQSLLDRERARVSARSRGGERGDTTGR